MVIARHLPPEHRQRFPDRVKHEGGQAFRQIAQLHPRLVAGHDHAEFLRALAGQEIPHLLPRCLIVRSPRDIGQAFQPPLQLHPGKRPAGKVPLRADVHHQPGIGVEFGAGILAHSVGDDAAFL